MSIDSGFGRNFPPQDRRQKWPGHGDTTEVGRLRPSRQHRWGRRERTSCSASRITVHVVLEQQTNIIAACDLETLGISFHNETREGASQAWLGFRDGTGVALTKQGGLFYLRGSYTSDGGVVIGDGGYIRFLVGTGAQASLFAQSGMRLLHEIIEPTVTLRAAGGAPLNVAATGTLRIRHYQGAASLMCPVTMLPTTYQSASILVISLVGTEGSSDEVEGRARGGVAESKLGSYASWKYPQQRQHGVCGGGQANRSGRNDRGTACNGRVLTISVVTKDGIEPKTRAPRTPETRVRKPWRARQHVFVTR